MNRSVWMMAACLAFGAGGMFLASNFRLRLEPVADPVAVPAPVAAAQPAPLPDALINPARPGIVDPAVQPASGIGAAVPGLQATPGAAATAAAGLIPPAKAKAIQVTKVVDDGFIWPVVPNTPVYLIKPTSPKIRLDRELEGTEELTLTVNSNKVLEKGKGFEFAEGKLTSEGVTITDPEALLGKGGVLKITFGIKFTGTNSAPVELRLPSDLPRVGLAVKQYTNSKNLDPVDATETGGTILTTGAVGFLRLYGESRGGDVSLQVVSQATEGEATFVSPPGGLVKVDRASGRWDAELNVLATGTTDVTLTVRATLNDAHAYLGKPLKFAVSSAPPSLAAPVLRTFTPEASKPFNEAKDIPVAGDIKTFRTNTRKMASVLVESSENAKTVTLYVNNLKVGKDEPVNGKKEEKTFSNVDLGTTDEVVVKAVSVAGPVVSRDATVIVKVREKGPMIRDVIAPGFGTGGGTERVVLKLSNRSQLDAETVKSQDTYELQNLGGGATLKPTGFPDYDPIADTVTLTYKTVLPASYKLVVKSTNGIKDLFGNVLQKGPGGTSDSDFEAVLTPQSLDQVTSPTAGVPLQPGPVVTFPEYTKFREVPDGFNPSDRVETRVARLYYYRDAHRVAMIVNRSVKSYAAADVDVRRRAADRARTDADNATDERKRLYETASKAAQDARAAETQLQEALRKQADARVQSANARVILPQRELELQQATQALGRGTALTADLAATDEAVRATKLRLDEAQRSLDFATFTAEQAKKLDPNQQNQQLTADRERRLAEIGRDNAKADFDRAVTEARLRADAGVDPNRANVARLTSEVSTLRQVVATADANAAAAATEIAQLQQRVSGLREAEFQRTVAWQEQELRERRARETEFRRDVAAATADPNTYAPGDPTSNDPVLQVSVSVIGEGLIQLRGPIKGINVIRIMINQIDAPVGQVRVAMHTVQVNGERGDRMEKVVANIQRYLDHSRFLTTQSSQMLRRSVGVVASRKAEEAALTLAPGCTQQDRDQRYLYAFFGKEFTDELALLDSEFLKTGNKLLSLHSMDTTSLASAMFVLSLARNDVRLEIMQEFNRLLQTELPDMENNYYLAGLSGLGHKCDACCDRRVYMLSQNARFVSFGGFFNAEGAAADTMTPLQREFIRLAQVFKARLVTEIQLKQRVTERAMVEERFAKSYPEQRKEAFAAEEAARKKLAEVAAGLPKALAEGQDALGKITDKLDGVNSKTAAVTETIDAVLPDFVKKAQDFVVWNQILKEAQATKSPLAIQLQEPREITMRVGAQQDVVRAVFVPGKTASDPSKLYFKSGEETAKKLNEIGAFLDQFYYDAVNYKTYLDTQGLISRVTREAEGVTPAEFAQLRENILQLVGHIRAEATKARQAVATITVGLRAERPDLLGAMAQFQAVRESIRVHLRRDQPLFGESERLFERAARAFEQLGGYEEARRRAEQARRPIDEKKLLDLLVDEIEDKFIEQLEGTRAHTANIDNYIKALSTALDDDFQTQFYNPSFRRVREAAARFWDVTLGQIESTTVLANNRGLALVRPSATFEFDLPKRDIMITEGFKSAKALVDDYGALVNDPSFLALAKLYSGNPVSGQQNTGGSMSSVRSVLPGLPVTADEMVMAQAGPGRREFGSALEGLIPDPAIYKFETGTGFELRPTLSPDGQCVVFKLDYMYTTDVREPVRADEKHLGRVKRHFVSTDVQLSNYELREVSTYRVALRASRTGKGVPGLQDIPGVGVLFRPLPSSESSLQQNLIYSQATIFPTLFDLMGLRYAPAVVDLDPLADRLSEFAARNRQLDIMQRTADIGATRVDEALRTPPGERRTDLYRPVVTIPSVHPNGYSGPGLRLRDGPLMEGPPSPPGFDPRFARPQTQFAPGTTPESAPRPIHLQPSGPIGYTPPGATGAPGMVPPVRPYPLPAQQDVPLTPNARPPFAGAATGTAPPAGANLGTVITPGVRPLANTPGMVPPPFPAPVGLPAPTQLPPGYPTTLPTPIGSPFPLQR